MPRRSAKAMDEADDLPAPADSAGPLGSIVRGARLEPIRFVERELTRRDGTTLRVKVPVYPPFRLEERPSPEPRSKPRPPSAARSKRPSERKKAS